MAESAIRTLPPVGDRAFAIDALVIVVMSIAICVASQELMFMSILVGVVFVVRLWGWNRLPEHERGHSLRAELLLLAICTVLGAFNDHSSVVRHGVYDYRVPVWFPEYSTIPLWMLAYWGLILRFVTSLTGFHRLAPRHQPRRGFRFGSPGKRTEWLTLLAQLGLVVFTRQCIYRLYGDPLLSWLPFAVALLLFAVLFHLTRRDLALMTLFLLGGPIVEISYIQLGDLHHYQLGWFGGVPLWIVLWWVLAIVVWQDLSVRLLLRLSPASQKHGAVAGQNLPKSSQMSSAPSTPAPLIDRGPVVAELHSVARGSGVMTIG